MSKNIYQVYTTNPITLNQSTDLMYFGQSPYGATNDAAMTYANFAAQFGAPYTASALTSVNDTNVTITLGGTPATSLLHAVSLTVGWSGTLAVGRGGLGISSTPANGQIPIGNGTNYTAATLSAGPGISIANGSGTITISGTAASIGWNTVTSATNMVTENGYITNSASLVSLTLPTTASVGNALAVAGLGSGGWQILQNAGQNIIIGNKSTTVGVGGSLASTNQYDTLYLLCIVANTTWTTLGAPQSAGLTIV